MTRDALWRKRARDELELRREVEALQLLGPGIVRLVDVEGDVLVLERRLMLLSEALSMAVDRMAGWGLVRAVLAEAWHVQDTGRVAGGPLRVADALARRVT